jgi:hypothetical protein
MEAQKKRMESSIWKGKSLMSDKTREELEVEISRLKQGLWDCAVISGIDTDGDTSYRHLSYPDIVIFAKKAVQDLANDYNYALDQMEI